MLVLGGTTEGRELSAALAGRDDLLVTTSLAGRVTSPPGSESPATPSDASTRDPMRRRVGGFGGVDGLEAWLRAHEVGAVVDATHPFAATMTRHAAAACAAAGVPLLRVERPAWQPVDGDDWHDVESVAAAAQSADRLGERLLVTTGRQEAAAFAPVRAWCLLRSIEAPTPPLPARHEILLDRGPFTRAGEAELIARHGIDVLVTKNSGGAATAPKLEAARDAGIPVVMVARAALPPGLTCVADTPAALAWLEAQASG